MNIELKNLSVINSEYGITLLTIEIPNIDGYIITDGDEIVNFEIDGIYARSAFQEQVTAKRKAMIPSNAVEFIKALGELYCEHRSDVSELCADFLENKLASDWRARREKRFVKGMVMGNHVCYDTLTTILEFRNQDMYEYDEADAVKYED